MLSPAARAGLEFRDEVETVNALVPGLRQQGIEAIVVLLHQGGVTAGGANECVDPAGPIVDIARRLDPAVDVVVSAHTHRAYICNLGGKLVTSAGSYGRFLTEIDLSIDPGVARRRRRGGGESLRLPGDSAGRRAGGAPRALRGRSRKDWSASWDGWAPRSRAGSTPMENRRSASSSRTPTSRRRRPPAPWSLS